MPQKSDATKVVHFKLKCEVLSGENRYLRQRVKDLTISRELHKDKKTGLQTQLRSVKLFKVKSAKLEVIGGELPQKDIGGHKYVSGLVSLCMLLYIKAGCSLRGVHRVLVCFQLEYGVFKGSVPSKSSIDNWVQKVGYYQYAHYCKDTYAGDYALIVDECMVIGKERLLVVLGINATKTGEEALQMSDVRLLGLAVKGSWTAQEVDKLVEQVQVKMGKRALYVISDGAANLKKGFKIANLARICDSGHEIAKCVEHIYKDDEEFKAFQTEVAGVKFREIMKETAYLLPPKQRTIARFMNLCTVVKWAKNLLKAFPHLTVTEQQTFAVFKQFEKLIEELARVFEMVNAVLKLLKTKGISFQNIDKGIEICKNYLTNLSFVV